MVTSHKRNPFLFLAAIALVLFCAGFVLMPLIAKNSAQTSHTNTASPTPDGRYELSKSEKYSASVAVTGGENILIDQLFTTNSCGISVKNEALDTLTVYLFDSTNTATSLMEFKLDGGSKKIFTNLTAAQEYYLGVASPNSTEAKLVVSDQ